MADQHEGNFQESRSTKKRNSSIEVLVNEKSADNLSDISTTDINQTTESNKDESIIDLECSSASDEIEPNVKSSDSSGVDNKLEKMNKVQADDNRPSDINSQEFDILECRSPKQSSIVFLNTEIPFINTCTKRRKTDASDSDETSPKKSRSSYAIIAEEQLHTISLLSTSDSSSDKSLIKEPIDTHQNSQEDFSLELTETVSVNDETDVISSDLSCTDKMDVSWQSQKDHANEINESDKTSSKENLHSFIEKCFMGGMVQFTVNKVTNQIISAEVKQLSLLGDSVKDKEESPTTSGYLADKSFSSGTSGDSRISTLGPFMLPANRSSILSSSSGSSLASLAGSHSCNGPFVVPSVPMAKKLKETVINHPLSFSGYSIPPVENLEEFLPANASPTLPVVGNMREKDESLNKKKNNKSKILEPEKLPTITEEKPVETVNMPQRRRRGRGKSRSVMPGKSIMEEKSKRTAKTVKTKGKEIVVKNEGTAVYAKWSDSRYYPGWASDDLNASRVRVNFCDGNVITLSSVKIIPVDWVTVGTIILEQRTNNWEYSPCLIEEIIEQDERIYIVDGNFGSKELKFSCSALTESQVAEVKQSAIAAGRTSCLSYVTLHNLINHPRTRTQSQSAPSAMPTSSRVKEENKPSQSTTSNGVFDLESLSYVATGTDTSMTSNSSRIHGNAELFLDPECLPQEFPSSSKRKTTQQNLIKSSGRSELVIGEEMTMVQLYGPYPNKESKIFTGCNFLVTYTDKKNPYLLRYRKAMSDSPSSESSHSQNSEDKFDSKSFNKQRICFQIKKGGGILYNCLEEVPASEYNRTYLITDKPSYTSLYLQCLVHGINIYWHKRIIMCCEENMPFNDVCQTMYLLPAGWSLEKKIYTCQNQNTQPLRNLPRGILLALTTKKTVVQFWRNLLRAMGGVIHVQKNKVTSLDAISVIVTDNLCSNELIVKADQCNIPLLSLIWVEQCIIEGRLIQFDAHPEYQHNYIPEYTSSE